MLRRIWINNYKCFVNFEFKPLPFQFIMGANGTGKTALGEALQAVRDFTTGNYSQDFPLAVTSPTRWLADPRQSFELDVELEDQLYTLQLQIERLPQQPQARVVNETVHLNGRPIFQFHDGEVRLYRDNFEQKVAYPFRPSQSALATIDPSTDNCLLTRFKNWLANLYFIKMNPLTMADIAKAESPAPAADLSNYASWYRQLSRAARELTGALDEDLKEVLDGFVGLHMVRLDENAELLATQFRFGANAPSAGFALGELSDGQRALIGLYTILHASVVSGKTIYLDEPENFVALREIEPWLAKLRMQAEDNDCQVMLASHHPEFINRLATRFGVEFVKEGNGFVRVRPFEYGPDEVLAPAELVARGWNE